MAMFRGFNVEFWGSCARALQKDSDVMTELMFTVLAGAVAIEIMKWKQQLCLAGVGS